MQAVADLSVLIVDSNASMRTQLRDMLALCNITKVSIAMTAGVAVRKLRDAEYDIILCEYHLGDGQDGQHLLEDLRQHHLIPLWTVFIMITGEAVYERVVSAAELAPNDYILKPFSSDKLLERLLRSMVKRDAFLPTYRLIEAGNTVDAIEACRQGEAQHPQYLVDFLRMRAELHVAAGQPDQAQAVYEQVLQAKAVPWAKLGLAKTLYLLKQYEQAERALEALVQENNLYLDAYDWLARTREAVGKLQAAQGALQHAVQISPHTVRRLRKLGEVSSENGDMSTAAKTMTEVVRKGKYSDFRDPEDHVLLVKAQLGQGDLTAASATLRDLERNMEGLAKTALCKAVGTAMLATQQGDEAKAAAALDEALKHNGETGGQGASIAIKKDLARICIEQNRDDQAALVIMDVMRNAPDEAAVERIKDVLVALGRPELGENLAVTIKTEVRDLMAEGARLAQSGDYEHSVAQMLSAVTRLPGNTNVLFNAALALLKHIEHLGWDKKKAATARDYIGRVRAQDPANAKLAALISYFTALQKKYGVRADQF